MVSDLMRFIGVAVWYLARRRARCTGWEFYHVAEVSMRTYTRKLYNSWLAQPFFTFLLLHWAEPEVRAMHLATFRKTQAERHRDEYVRFEVSPPPLQPALRSKTRHTRARAAKSKNSIKSDIRWPPTYAMMQPESCKYQLYCKTTIYTYLEL